MSGHSEKLALPKFLSFLKNRPTKEEGLISWLTTVDHKRIGILYLYTSFFFLFVGGIEALFVRTQLSANDLEIFVGSTYNQLVTMHATTMIFLAIMPLAAAFFNFIIPLQIGARDVAFPRLNAFSYFMYLAGGIVLNASWFMGGASGAEEEAEDSRRYRDIYIYIYIYIGTTPLLLLLPLLMLL